VTELAPGAITTADLYRELSAMTVKLAVIEATTARAEQVYADHETRLRLLERFRWTVFGAASAIGSASGVIAALIVRGHG
jgi:hypothetical protein